MWLVAKTSIGVWISGAVRRDEANQLVREQGELDRENILLRSFRLPNPPMSHLWPRSHRLPPRVAS